MKAYKHVPAYLELFLKDLSSGTDFTYEITCRDPKRGFVTTYRLRDIYQIAKKMAMHADTRNIFISPFNTRYPERSSNFVYGRKMISSNSIVIDIDSKKGHVDYHLVLKKLKKNGIPEPTYLTTSGSGCHLWYVLSHHVEQNRLRIIYEKIRNKIASISWPKQWHIDDLSVKQQFRIPFSINHNYGKTVMLVNRGKKVDIKDKFFVVPKQFTKKELKRHKKEKKPKEPTKKLTKIKNNKVDRFLDGSKSLLVTLKQKVVVDQRRLKRIIQLLSYGKEFLSCRVAGKALGISHMAAATFLRKCIAYGYLEKFDSSNSAYSYKVKVDCEVEKIKVEKGRCHIDGPGQSNKAMCRLAYQAYKFGLDKIKTVTLWLSRYYNLTSGEHSPNDLIATYESVYGKFEKGRYQVFGTT